MISPEKELQIYNNHMIKLGELRQNLNTEVHILKSSDIIDIGPTPEQLAQQQQLALQAQAQDQSAQDGELQALAAALGAQ